MRLCQCLRAKLFERLYRVAGEIALRYWRVSVTFPAKKASNIDGIRA